MTGQELENIPRVLTGVADWLACMLYLTTQPRRFHGTLFYAISLAFLPMICLFLVLTDGLDGILFNIFMFFSAVLMLLFLYLCIDAPITNAMYTCARSFILAGFAASLSWQLFTYFYLRVSLFQRAFVEHIFISGFLFFTFFIFYLIEHRQRRRQMDINLSTRETSSAVIIALSVYVLSSLSYAPLETPFGSSSDIEAFNIRTIVYAAGLALLYAYHSQMLEYHARYERDALQNIFQMQYNNYKVSKQSIELVNQKYHDMKHMIMVLRNSGDVEQSDALLNQLEDEIKSFELGNKTGNEVLDTMLTGKSIQCRAHGIRLTCVADGQALDYMTAMDISTLFGNALDNAIEGVRKLPEEKRLIHLSVSREKDFVRIRVENCYEGHLEFQGGHLSTTKADKQNHGYGLKSIRSTARKYGGSVTIQAKNGWFELRILLPMP